MRKRNLLTLQRQTRYLQIYLLLGALEAIGGALILFTIPGEGGPLFGFSLQRIGLAGFMIVAGILAGVMGWVAGRGGKVDHALIGTLQKNQDPLMAIALITGILLTTCVIVLGIRTPTEYAAYYKRLLPFLLWLDLLAVQGLLFFPSVILGKQPLRAYKCYLARQSIASQFESKMPFSVSRKFRLTFWITFLVILVPSADLAMFSGVPLSGLAEGILLVLYLPLLFHRQFQGWLEKKIYFKWKIILVVNILVLGLKVILFASNEYQGFAGCYRTTVSPPPNGQCELSYENPLFRFDATRIDRTIDFPAGHWDLSFINANRFNFYFWEKDKILQGQAPDWTWIGRGI